MSCKNDHPSSWFYFVLFSILRNCTMDTFGVMRFGIWNLWIYEIYEKPLGPRDNRNLYSALNKLTVVTRNVYPLEESPLTHYLPFPNASLLLLCLAFSVSMYYAWALRSHVGSTEWEPPWEGGYGQEMEETSGQRRPAEKQSSVFQIEKQSSE